MTFIDNFTPRGPRVIDAMPVELLRDGRGVYGIGVTDETPLAQARYVEHARVVGACQPLILRPDCLQRLPRQLPRTAALQKIIGRCPVFLRTTEEALRQVIHQKAVELALPPDDGSDFRRCLTEEMREAEYRRKYHGLRLLSVSLINRLIGQLIEEAADHDAIRAARRFAVSYRQDLYGCGALSRRALQLIDTFPVLALALYSRWRLFEGGHPRAAILVERGARLRDVAAALEIPMALRHVKPGVAHLVTRLLLQHPDLLQFMPEQTPAARICLLTVDFAYQKGDEDFGRWVARHVSELPGGLQQVDHKIRDIMDWAHSCTLYGPRVITPRFTPSMALKTAIRASDEWHEEVASRIDDTNNFALPPPWYSPATQGGFDIVPLTTNADLYNEGHAMHHCVATYADQVRQGTSCIFSVRRSGKRIATISLACHGETVSIEQVRGPCNTAPPRVVAAAVRKWLRRQRTTVAAICQRHKEWSCATQTTTRQTWARAVPDNFDIDPF